MGAELLVAKLDIKKAYDTLLWTAVQRSFDRGCVPQDLQDMYWRRHKGRRLQQFRTSDGLVSFSAIASRGLPQDAPESPLIYAAVVEDLIQDVEDMLRTGRAFPVGVSLDNTLDPHTVQTENDFGARLDRHPLHIYKLC